MLFTQLSKATSELVVQPFFEASFASVLPRQRARSEILAELDDGGARGATSATKAQLAEIELHVHDGDVALRGRSYQAALDEFKTARGLIFRILHPAFDVSA